MATQPLNLVALKRQAKHNAKQNNSVLADELQALAEKHGEKNWSRLDNRQKRLVEDGLADRYTKDVYIRFENRSTHVTPGAVQLLLKPEVLNKPLPWNAWLTDVSDEGQTRIIAKIQLNFDSAKDGLPADVAEKLKQALVQQENVLVPEHWALFTWFTQVQDYVQFAGHGSWWCEQVLRSVNDLTYARATGYEPVWYEEALHSTLFEDPASSGGTGDDDLDYIMGTFCSTGFKRGSDGQRLVERLARIQTGTSHAAAFQQWVADALKALFPDGLTRVRVNPNGKNAKRRDIVANNTGQGAFFGRLLQDYKARTVVFEAKNYTKLKPADFRQVRAYLSAFHHGKIGFLVSHAPTADVSEANWGQVRAIYNEEGSHKLVIVLPSAFLAEMLNILWFKRPEYTEGEMERWLDDVLDKHLGD